ncbi:MAG: hypothetical protein WAP51_03115, partial [Candidatus Sungiibacteriota bacterium]
LTPDGSDVLVTACHLPTITLGASSIKEQLTHLKPIPREWLEEPEEELFNKTRDFLKGQYGVNLVKTDRGGSLWYHDAGVPTFYFIADVKSGFPGEIVQPLEEALCQTVASLGLNPERKPERWQRRFQNHIGVWVQGKNVAGVGVRLRRFGKRTISLFGAALNIDPNMTNMQMIEPCGIKNAEATSIRLLHKNRRWTPSDDTILSLFCRTMEEVFEAEVIKPKQVTINEL